MSVTVFLDTNVLVYPYDRREPERGKQALALLEELAATGAAAVSTQVLGEFFWVITRRIPDPLPTKAGGASVERHARTWTVLEITLPVVREALRGVQQHRMAYWDALIWATARLAQIPLVLSEDFADESEVDGVRFLNPLRSDFELFLP